MSHVKLLDCTLRDGAYLIDKKFGEQTIRGIIDGLVKTNIDFIEIGFFQDEGFGEGKTVFKSSEDAKRYIPKKKHGCEFTVLADYSRYTISNLDERTEDGIDAVRECFFKHERNDVIEACREIKKKGYKLFVQPVDILGYSDIELIQLLDEINSVEPYCISIVDTFGSMYQEDLQRVFEIINHNLINTCKIGFHSHNNMQLSNALSQDFIRISTGKRDVIVDGTISGMGRGAGNTPTELITQYVVSKLGGEYDIDALLDVIDTYMDEIRTRCTWGYNTEYFVAGCFSAHVNNIGYLKKKNSIRSKDIRLILNTIGSQARKRYDYELLETTYIKLLNSDIDDSKSRKRIIEMIANRPVLMLAPGNSVNEHLDKVEMYINEYNPFIISINFIHEIIKCDCIYISNMRRYSICCNTEEFRKCKKIMTSNFPKEAYDEKTEVISFTSIIKCGWDTMDNSAVMLLRLLSDLSIKNVAIAGFDGYSSDTSKKNYSTDNLELESSVNNAVHLNEEIREMLLDFNKTRRQEDMNIQFITLSRFAHLM